VTSTIATHDAPVHSASTVNALLLPADPAEPIGGLTVEGLHDVRAAVGGQLEGFSCPADPTVWGYACAVGNQLAGGDANARATSILNPHGPWITGNVVLVAAEDHHHDACTLPPRLATLLAEPEVLPEPSISARGNTAAFHAWELVRDDNGGTVMAVLTIALCPALEEPIGLAEEYTATLATRRERPDLFGGRICCDGLSTAHCVLREGGVAICRNNTGRFAALALATVNALYAVGDERVTTHFRRPA
jgi:hypothetical protein